MHWDRSSQSVANQRTKAALNLGTSLLLGSTISLNGGWFRAYNNDTGRPIHSQYTASPLPTQPIAEPLQIQCQSFSALQINNPVTFGRCIANAFPIQCNSDLPNVIPLSLINQSQSQPIPHTTQSIQHQSYANRRTFVQVTQELEVVLFMFSPKDVFAI